MPAFQKPAPAATDAKLFENSPAEIRELNKRARKELREQARRTYAYSQRISPRRP